MKKFLLAASLAGALGTAAPAAEIEVGKVAKIGGTILCDTGRSVEILERLEKDFVSGLMHFQKLKRTPSELGMYNGKPIPTCVMVRERVEMAILSVGTKKYTIKLPNGRVVDNVIVRVGYRDGAGKIKKGEIIVDTRYVTDPGLGT